MKPHNLFLEGYQTREYEKDWPIRFFFTSRIAFFSEICFCNDLLRIRITEKILKTQQKTSKWIVEPKNLLPQVFCHARYIERKLSHFFHLEKSIFLKICLSTSYVIKKVFYHVHNKCQRTLWTLISCSLSFVILDKTRMLRPTNFIYLETRFFYQKFVLSKMSYVLQKWSYNFHSVSQKTIWTLTKRSLRFVTLDNRREKGPKSFVTLEYRLFWKCLLPTTSYVP